MRRGLRFTASSDEDDDIEINTPIKKNVQSKKKIKAIKNITK